MTDNDLKGWWQRARPRDRIAATLVSMPIAIVASIVVDWLFPHWASWISVVVSFITMIIVYVAVFYGLSVSDDDEHS